MLSPLLAPETVAVIGASRSPGKVGHEIVQNLVAGGFRGTLVAVNPHAEEILGVRCCADLGAYGHRVDLAVIAVPAAGVRAAAESAAAAGARAIAVVSAGFKERGPAGAEQEAELAKFCKRRGIRLLGPNSLGLINTQHALNASFGTQMPTMGGISVVSQSGATCTAILDWAKARHLGLAKVVSIGNKADLTESDLLLALANDDATTVIVGYLESIESGDEFVKAAEFAASMKPVIILKGGTSPAGIRAAVAHTGSQAGADIAYGAAFRRAGVIRADSFDSLLDRATAFAMQPLPRGDRVAIITNAGGPGILAADALEHAGLQVATLSGETARGLRARLPEAASVGNPIDVLGDADPERYAAAVDAAQDDPAVDAIIVILTPQAMTRPAETARAVAARLRGDKPAMAVFMGGRDVLPGRRELTEKGLPEFSSPERAVSALKAMVEYVRWRNRPPRVVTRFPVNRRRVERVIRRYLRLGQVRVGEIGAKEILRAYDFNVPPGDIASTAESAVILADRIGYPVALKIVSPDIVHKSDLGGVKLNLTDAEAVRDAFDLMMVRVGRLLPSARLEGVYVEKMARRGREVIIGMNRDPQFGPMLMFGLGGIFVEVMKDVTFHLAPITAEEALQMLRSTRSFSLLTGGRGELAVDLEAVARGLQRVSQLAKDFPQIQELDINPFIVGAVGIEPVVADARIVLVRRPGDEPARSEAQSPRLMGLPSATADRGAKAPATGDGSER
jgi:acetyltransferase